MITGLASGASPAAASNPQPLLYEIDLFGNTINAFPATATGNATPTATISDNGGSLNTPSDAAFDAAGDLWVANGDGTSLSEFTPSQLAATGSPAPAVVISGLTKPTGLAFDSSEDIWVTTANGIEEFTPGQLVTSGSPTAVVTLSGAADNSFGLTFDTTGDLWVANDTNAVLEYTQAQILTSGSPTPAVTVTPPDLLYPALPMFDAKGDLWLPVHAGQDRVEYTPDQLTPTGSPAPAGFLGVFDHATGFQFDTAGNLWLALGGDLGVDNQAVLEFTPDQLAGGGSPTPAVTPTSSAFTFPGDVVIAQPPVARQLALRRRCRHLGHDQGRGVPSRCQGRLRDRACIVGHLRLSLRAPSTRTGGARHGQRDCLDVRRDERHHVSRPVRLHGERLLGGGIRRGHLRLQRAVLRFYGRQTIGRARCQHGRHPERSRLLGGGVRRRHLLLRRALRRLHGREAVGCPGRRDGRRRRDRRLEWVASDGGVFAYNAPYFGSMGGMPLNAAIVGMAAAPGGNGYWLVGKDGGIFGFGPGAVFSGSQGGKPLNAPVVGMTGDTVTTGYWEVASDGGVFNFGAPVLGSMGGQPLNAPMVGMGALPGSSGYWEVASDGGIFAYNALFVGSMGGKHLNAPMVGIGVP